MWYIEKLNLYVICLRSLITNIYFQVREIDRQTYRAYYFFVMHNVYYTHYTTKEIH